MIINSDDQTSVHGTISGQAVMPDYASKILDALVSEYRQAVYHYTILAEYLKLEAKYDGVWHPTVRSTLLDFRTPHPNSSYIGHDGRTSFAAIHNLNSSIIAHYSFCVNLVAGFWSYNATNKLINSNGEWKGYGKHRRSFQRLLFDIFHSSNLDEAGKNTIIDIETVLKEMQNESALSRIHMIRNNLTAHKDVLPDELLQTYQGDIDHDYIDIWKAVLASSQMFITIWGFFNIPNFSVNLLLDHFVEISETEIDFAKIGFSHIKQAITSVSHRKESTNFSRERIHRHLYCNTQLTIQSPTPREYAYLQLAKFQILDILDETENGMSKLLREWILKNETKIIGLMLTYDKTYPHREFPIPSLLLTENKELIIQWQASDVNLAITVQLSKSVISWCNYSTNDDIMQTGEINLNDKNIWAKLSRTALLYITPHF